MSSYDDLPVKVAQPLAKVRSTTQNENGETVEVSVVNLIVQRDR